jgi:hypothetical protein
MADNKAVKDATGTNFDGAMDELADGAFSPKVSILAGDATATPIDPRLGNVAHDGVDSGAPNKVGGKAIAHGANPTAVAAADRTDWYFNRAGIPFVIGGHPNIVSKGHIIADSDGAQTDAALIGSISAGTKIVLTRISVVCDNANTGDCAITIGFGTANVPTPTLAGATGIVVNGSFDGGAGITIGDGSGIIAVGADGEELRITCSDPAGGNIRVSYSYFTIES